MPDNNIIKENVKDYFDTVDAFVNSRKITFIIRAFMYVYLTMLSNALKFYRFTILGVSTMILKNLIVLYIIFDFYEIKILKSDSFNLYYFGKNIMKSKNKIYFFLLILFDSFLRYLALFSKLIYFLYNGIIFFFLTEIYLDLIYKDSMSLKEIVSIRLDNVIYDLEYFKYILRYTFILMVILMFLFWVGNKVLVPKYKNFFIQIAFIILGILFVNYLMAFICLPALIYYKEGRNSKYERKNRN